MVAMKIDRVSLALTVLASGALLTACGVSQPPPIAAPPSIVDARGLPNHKTFHYEGHAERFKVPATVNVLQVVALGAAGADVTTTSDSQESSPGSGGRVYAVLPVTPRETLYVFVGSQGSTTGGFNGGGNPGAGGDRFMCFGGGGASDVRENGRTSRDRILVAAGGGGQGCGYEDGGVGGAGGASTGANGGAPYDGGASGGSGGTQIGGGAGGLPGQGSYNRHDGMPGRTGKLAQGGNGGNGGVDHRCNGSNYFCRAGGGGGGGGGYYGGGGGGGGGALYFYGKPGAGGGGGSSYVEQSAQRARMWRGWKTAKGNGLVVFSW